MRKLIIAIALLALLIAVVGCKVTPPAEPTGTVGEVSGDITGVGTLEEDVSTADVDNLDTELEEVDW